MVTQTIEINFKNNIKKNSYSIYIGSRLLKKSTESTELTELTELTGKHVLQQHVTGNQVMVVTNETIAPLYLSSLRKIFSPTLYQYNEIILLDGEQYKNLSQCQRIWDALIDHQHHRDTTLIALGGGVIGDMTGFAASCYQRGAHFMQIPTSLLAQVDASVGGKTGINHDKGKNLIGTFHQPRAVIIDIDTLKTLPQREYRSGIAEIIKAALISDRAFFAWLENNMTALVQQDSTAVITAIKRACEIKRDTIAEDEREETGQRALLNFGHTFGHAIETALGYGVWCHGEAVAVGMVLAAKLSHQQGLIRADDVARIQQLLTRAALPTALPESLSVETVLSAMQMDKKILAGKLRLVLLSALGQAVLIDHLRLSDIQAILR